MELRHLKLLTRWLWLLALFPIITAIIGYLYVQSKPTNYEAISTMIIGPGIDTANPDLDALRTGAQLMQTYAELPLTDSFLDTIITNLNLDLDKGDLEDMIDIRPTVDTQIFKIAVQDEDPERAKAIANAIAQELMNSGPSTENNAFLLERMQEQARSIEQDIVDTQERVAVLRGQLEIEPDINKQNLIIQQIADEERRLASANTTLGDLYEILQRPLTNRVMIIDEAEEANVVDNQLPLNMIIAIAIGLVISAMLGAALLFYETSLVNLGTLSEYVNVPILGNAIVSKSPDGMLTVDKLPESEAATQYYKLGTQLLYRREVNNISSILVTNIEPNRQAAEVAANLAVITSMTDNAVVLLDIDLHSNFISNLFEIENSPSLANILMDESDRNSPIPATKKFPHLAVLPSGVTTPARAFTLLASPKMTKVLEEAKNRNVLLILNAPPLAIQEDSYTIGAKVDGVVLVAQHRRSRVVEVQQAIDGLNAVGAHVMGIIVTNTNSI